MLDGSAAPEITTSFAPPRAELPKPARNFTPYNINRYERPDSMPLPRFEKPVVVEPPKYQEDPTVSMTPEDKALTDRLMAQIMEKPKSTKPQEVVQQIEKNIPQEKKSKGFLANIWSRILRFLGLR